VAPRAVGQGPSYRPSSRRRQTLPKSGHSGLAGGQRGREQQPASSVGEDSTRTAVFQATRSNMYSCPEKKRRRRGWNFGTRRGERRGLRRDAGQSASCPPPVPLPARRPSRIPPPAESRNFPGAGERALCLHHPSRLCVNPLSASSPSRPCLQGEGEEPLVSPRLEGYRNSVPATREAVWSPLACHEASTDTELPLPFNSRLRGPPTPVESVTINRLLL